MPILLVIFLVAACAPVAWPEPPFGWGRESAAAIALVALVLPIVAHLILSLSVVRAMLRNPLRRGRVAARYSRFRRLIGLGHFALAIASIGLGWGWLVQKACTVEYGGRVTLAPFAELLVPLPFLIGVFAAWILHHDAERVLHRTGAGPNAPFWNRGGHFLHRLRPYLLLVLLPAGLFATHQTFLRFAPSTAQSDAAQWITALLAPMLFILMPLLAKPALGLKSLPRGHHRDRFEHTAKRLKFRCTDLLIWHTHGTVANAMVLGLIPQARYVVFTDHLLEHLDDDELDAVFGHEVGHVKYGHLLYYAVFFVLSMMVILGIAVALANEAEKAGLLTARQIQSHWLDLPPLALLAGYLFLVFGLLSRKCERQADLYGVHTVASGRTEGHPKAAGVASMTRALSKVAYINGMDTFGDYAPTRLKRLWANILAWQHGSIGDRIEFLNRILDDPDLEKRVQRRITVFRWCLIAGLASALVALGAWLGWTELVALL